MDLLKFFLLTGVTILQAPITVADKKRTDHCILDDKPGLCVALNECPHLHNLKNNNGTLRLCGVERQIPLVCCVANLTKPPQQEAIALSYDSTKPEQSGLDVPISLRKCKQYARFANGDGVTRTEGCRIGIDGRKSGPAYQGEFPHMAGLLYRRLKNNSITGVYCGGSLISEKFVVTVAHCISPKNFTLESVILGAFDLENYESDINVQKIPVAQKIIHPDYRINQPYFDVALIQLARPPIIGLSVRPACLPTNGEDFSSRELTLIGWGKTRKESSSKELLKAAIFEASHERCQNDYKNYTGGRFLRRGIHHASMLCAGHPTKRTDACQGDSGGPIQVISLQVPCMYTIAGMTSFGSRPCGRGISGVYVRLQYFRTWIENIVWS